MYEKIALLSSRFGSGYKSLVRMMSHRRNQGLEETRDDPYDSVIEEVISRQSGRAVAVVKWGVKRSITD
jgi:hypothetical protein